MYLKSNQNPVVKFFRRNRIQSTAVYGIGRYRTEDILKNLDFSDNELKIETRLIRNGRQQNAPVSGFRGLCHIYYDRCQQSDVIDNYVVSSLLSRLLYITTVYEYVYLPVYVFLSHASPIRELFLRH